MIRAMTCALVLSISVLGLPHAQEANATRESPAWIDFDGDGRLDLYWIDADGSDRVYRNSSGAGFEDLTGAVGLENLGPARFGLWEDVDRDGRTDLVRADAEGKLVLFKNRGGALLEAVGAEAGLAEIANALHGEWCDVDRDGWADLWVVRHDEAVLLHNVEGTRFEASRVAASADSAAPTTEALRLGGEQDHGVAPKPGDREREPAGNARTRFVDPARRPADLSLAGLSGSGETPLVAATSCARSLDDLASGACLFASTVPALGRLYPLSIALNVDVSGRVGVGTTALSHKLTVQAPNDDALRLIGAGAFGSQARLNFGDGDFAYLYEDEDDSLEIHTKDGLRITGGSVGIGTLFPVWSLHVVAANQAVGRFDSNASTFGSAIELRNNTASPTDLGAINFVNSASQIRGQIAYKGAADAPTFSAGGPERMRIDGATGRIGIGTTVPAFPVDIRGAAQVFNPLVQVEETGGAAFASALEARTSNSSATALRGFNLSTSGGTGASGLSNGDTGTGVLGTHAGDGVGYGVRGSSQSASGYGVFSAGAYGGTGAKYFVQPHPSDLSKEIRFVCLEGNESGTYFRGSAALAAGRAVIEVPEEFRLVTEPEGLTVQLTPKGDARLWVEEEGLERIVVRGSADVSFHYLVNGVRRGFAELECVRENHAFVPEERGVPYGTQYPEAYRRILVENGILNPDFTPNEATAARMGWVLADPSASAETSPRSLR